MSSTMAGARGIITLGKKIASSSGSRRTCSPAHLQRTSTATQNDLQPSSSFSSVTGNNVKKEASTNQSSSVGKRNLTTVLASGGIVDEPERYRRFGLLKVVLTMTAGLTVGSWISKNMAAFLEENELFVPEDDDDDDDDDDD